MVFAVDVFIIGAIFMLGAAYFYIIADCAQKNIIIALKCEKKNAVITKQFMREVAAEHADNKKLQKLGDEFADSCSELRDCKL